MQSDCDRMVNPRVNPLPVEDSPQTLVAQPV